MRFSTATAREEVICIDPFHAVALVTTALDVVRRATWNELRQLPDQTAAKKFKGARWSLLKRPENLTEDQAATLRKLRRRGGDLWRAYALKEAFRAIFSGDLDPDQSAELIDRWCSKASRSRLAPFVKVSKTIRKFRDGILAALRLKINNARAEGLNNHVRLIIRRAYGFHSPQAAPLCPGHAHLRTHQAPPTPRTNSRMTHIHAGRPDYVCRIHPLWGVRADAGGGGRLRLRPAMDAFRAQEQFRLARHTELPTHCGMRVKHSDRDRTRVGNPD